MSLGMEAFQLLPSSLPMDETDQLNHRKSKIFHALGWFGIICLTLGSVIIISSFSFILFLWKADASNVVWQHIIIAAWLTRSVTLSSLLIRIAAGALATLSTSMLAALSLQHYYILLPDSAAATLIQFQNSGPLSLAVLLSRSLHAGRSSSIALLVIILWISTLILQFSSTILLFDVGNGMIPGFQQHRAVPFGLDGSSDLSFTLADQYLNNENSLGYWITSPAVYPAFAEYTEPPAISDGVHDTGFSMRAFLPFPLKQQRNLLNSYDGMATVFDSRVVCMRPSIKDLIVSLVIQPVEKGDFTIIEGSCPPFFTGVVGTNLTAPRFKAMASDNGAVLTNSGPNDEMTDITDPLQPFNCSSAFSGQDGADEWPLVFCPVGQSKGIISAMQKIPDAKDESLHSYLNGNPGAAYLVFNMSGSWERWTNYSNQANPALSDLLDFNDTLGKGNLSFLGPGSHESSGEWLVIPSSDPEIHISASICYTAFVSATRQVQVSSPVNTSEPAIVWDPKGVKFTPEAIQNQLGTLDDSISLSSRGVFSLRPLTSWLWALYDPNDITRPSPVNLEQDGNSKIACYDCRTSVDDGSGSFTIINPELSAIFGDIVRKTGHPALALQSIFTILFGKMYYAVAPQFVVLKNATIVSFADSARPVAWRGFTVLAVAVAALLLGVGATLPLICEKWIPRRGWKRMAGFGATSRQRSRGVD